jgi:hypothetical protein
MNFETIFCRQSMIGRVMHLPLRCGVAALVLAATAVPASAGTYDGAMGRTNYVVMSADINGDGQNDVLFKALPKFILIPFDDDLVIPIRIAPPSPSFALISTAYGQYTLVANPDAQTLARTEWKPATQQVTYYGAAATFAASVAIRATSNDQASFVISMTMAGQLQISSITAPVTNNSAPPVVTLPSCD